MPCPLPPKSRPLLRKYIQKPYLTAARKSRAARRWLDKHGYVTPNFSWVEMGSNSGVSVPSSLRANMIRHCWRLELFRHRLGNVSISVDGPYRTRKYNDEIGGAKHSQHVQAAASDHFVEQVDRWVRQSSKVSSRKDVVQLAYRTFVAVGNEPSGTLHFDSRPGKIGSVRFSTW